MHLDHYPSSQRHPFKILSLSGVRMTWGVALRRKKRYFWYTPAESFYNKAPQKCYVATAHNSFPSRPKAPGRTPPFPHHSIKEGLAYTLICYKKSPQNTVLYKHTKAADLFKSFLIKYNTNQTPKPKKPGIKHKHETLTKTRHKHAKVYKLCFCLY